MKIKVISALLIVLSISAFAQKSLRENAYNGKMEWKPGTEVICPASHVDENTFIDVPVAVKKALALKKKARPSEVTAAKFEVLYDPGMPQVAQDAFQRAVDIWAELLGSRVKINVIALWQELGPNVLGSAGPGTYYRNFGGAIEPNTWYPIALAEKMAGKDLNSPDDFDIVARFSSEINWYYGTTGTPAVGQFDFTSVVLHELCHGLGFVGSMGVEGTQASYGFGSGIPVVFDSKLKNEKGQFLTDTLNFKNPSTGLRNELISENLFFESPRAENNFGKKIKLYAPTIYEGGSSVYHLDDRTFPAGTENSLMTPTAGIREINYDPGPIVMDMFADMGWKGTSIVHDAVKDFETATSVEIKATIFSDTTLKANTAKLSYVELDPATATLEALNTALEAPKVVNMVRQGTSDVYSGNIPVANPKTLFVYYLTVEDDYGRMASSPPKAPTLYWLFEVGLEDQWGPRIEYFPPTIIRSGTGVDFVANVEDDFQAGIEKVTVNYSVNGGAKTSFDLKKFDPSVDTLFAQGASDETAYVALDGIPNLRDNDIVNLSITAFDKAGNATTIPTTASGTRLTDPTVADVYEFTATSLKDSINDGFLNFDTPTDDFAFTGWQISQPTGMTSPLLHTKAPYKNGLGLTDPVSGRTFLDYDYNAIALYRRPIVIAATDATISFDEIVLVEPGDDGSEYGDNNFWDFVIVEASLDFGQNWYELTEGYDSGKEKAWKDLFTSTLAPANAENPTSNGLPSPALFRQRVIDIYDAFVPEVAGREMLLRFRLYADQWVRGWGWAIDNLALQRPAQKPLANEKDLMDLKVSPNPASEFIDIKARFQDAQSIAMEIVEVTGRKMVQSKIELKDGELNERVDIKDYKSGTYLVVLKTDKGIKQTSRFAVVK